MSLDIYLTRTQPTTVHDQNITHNLNKMAEAAGLYYHLWRPEEVNIKTAGELIEPLEKGISEMESRPEY